MSVIEKIFGNAIFSAFVQELLTAEVGKSVLGGHATVTAVSEHSVTADVTIAHNNYEIVFTRKTT